MIDFETGGYTYRIGRMDAKQQLHVARRLASSPLQFILGEQSADSVPAVVRERAESSGMTSEEVSQIMPKLLPSLSLRALGELSEADCDYVVNVCLSVCMRQQGSNGKQQWANVTNRNTGHLMFQDINLSSMLELTVQVLRENLSDFFGAGQSNSLPHLQPDQRSTG